MARNCYNVNYRVWGRWSKEAQAVFNRSYKFYIKDKQFMIHPKADVPTLTHWRTTAWNAAWIAADCVDNVVPSVIK